jgi:hypothetical protein
MMVYLALAMTTTHYALRKSLDAALLGPGAPFTWLRHVSLTLLILAASTSVALSFPGAADRIFSLTGATGVCLVCYVIPCYIHFKVLAHRRAMARGSVGAGAGAAACEGVRQPLLSSPFAGHAARLHVSAAQGGERGDGGGGEAEEEQQQQRQWQGQGEEGGCVAQGSKGGACAGAACDCGVGGWLHDVAVPVAVLLLGISCSAAALWVAVRDYVRAHEASE